VTPAEEAAEEYARAVVAAWPPLTPAQKDRIRVLFRVDAPADGQAAASAETMEQAS
jgi:hypothetical protein